MLKLKTAKLNSFKFVARKIQKCLNETFKNNNKILNTYWNFYNNIS